MSVTQREPYSGEVLDRCPPHPYPLDLAFAITVSGARWNPCGHLLLNAGGWGGHYFHVAERKGYPRLLDEAGYRRYLRESGKRELMRAYVPLLQPLSAMSKLEELLSQHWSWWLLPNNCASFVEDVLRAGGSGAGLYFNCPRREYFI